MKATSTVSFTYAHCHVPHSRTRAAPPLLTHMRGVRVCVRLRFRSFAFAFRSLPFCTGLSCSANSAWFGCVYLRGQIFAARHATARTATCPAGRTFSRYTLRYTALAHRFTLHPPNSLRTAYIIIYERQALRTWFSGSINFCARHMPWRAIAGRTTHGAACRFRKRSSALTPHARRLWISLCCGGGSDVACAGSTVGGVTRDCGSCIVVVLAKKTGELA